ncbi:N-acetylmuramoyl-L-alanine amidase [Haloimpatiens sp. FM7330]|uniref:N-acetylmuramoyl-L-alanine amidase n=1 Tax=Haloimpatiens sp. FM7330 TaxID=3298610 RepID=UPI00362EA169
MKIGIDCGHTISGPDYGAVGIKAESNLTREVGQRVISKLKTLGYSVIDCTCNSASSVGSSLSYRVNKANNNNVDLFISIHFNKFNGQAHGTEIWTYNGKKFKEAQDVLNNIFALGYTNRGIKDGSSFYVIKNTKMTSMLIECAFIDNKEDMNKYNANNLANAIVKGLTGKTVTEEQENDSEGESEMVSRYDDKTIPEGENIFKVPGTTGYIEQVSDGRLIIHKDRGNYIAIGKGFVDIYWNDNKGNGGSKRLTE